MSEQPVLYTEDGDEIVLPSKWAICDRCRGDGHHGNPAFDGLSADDPFWHDDDPDECFVRDYVAGKYDVFCEACDGSGKVREVDEDAMTPEQVEAWERQCYEAAEYRAICRMERMMGA